MIGFKSSTNPFSAQGFLNTAATETNKTGSLATLPPSIKVLSTNFVNFLKFKYKLLRGSKFRLMLVFFCNLSLW